MTNQYRMRANEKRKDQCIKVESLVWVQVEDSIPGTATKLNRKWKGPFKVKKVIDDGRAYELQDIFDGTVVKRAAEKLKMYIERDTVLGEVDHKFLNYQDSDEESDETEEPKDVRVRKPPKRLITEM